MKNNVLAMALIALTAMGCSKEDSVPAGGSPMTFTGVAPAASVPASAASSRSYFPGTSGLMYWSDYDNIGAYAFDSSKALKAHDICTLQSGAGSGLAVFHPGISSIPRVGAVRAITRSTPIIPFGPPLPPLTATGACC